MIRKKMWTGQVASSVAVGALALAPMVAFAQGDTTGGGATGTGSAGTGGMSGGTGGMSGGTGGMSGGTGSMGGGTGSMGMSSQPTQTSGTIERYYTDQTGYVTAADVRTAEGTQMVHFGPGLGTRVTTAYPVGGTAQLWVTPGSGTGHWNVVGWGQNMPAAGFMQPHTSTAIDMLEGEPYIMAGTKMVSVRGKLTNIITNDMGEVVALALNGDQTPGVTGGAQSGGLDARDPSAGLMTEGARGGTGGMSGHLWSSGNYHKTVSLDGPALIRVPREFRNINPMASGTRRITPLHRGSLVEVTGYPEAPLYGVVSIYPYRIAASTISIDGESVGYGSLPVINKKAKPLLGFNINLPFMGRAADEGGNQSEAMGMGYSTYNATPSGMVEGGAGTGMGGTGMGGTGMGGTGTGGTGGTGGSGGG